jgi:hypothetical protein
VCSRRNGQVASSVPAGVALAKAGAFIMVPVAIEPLGRNQPEWANFVARPVITR